MSYSCLLHLEEVERHVDTELDPPEKARQELIGSSGRPQEWAALVMQDLK